MDSAELTAKLTELGLALPPAPAPKGAYVPVVVHGDLAWVSGMLPLGPGGLIATGKVDAEVALPTAREAARTAALNGLSALVTALKGPDRILRVVRVGVFVASSPSFTAQPDVANGASELLLGLFGEAGRHARAAVGVASLPLNSPVEVEILVALGEAKTARGP